MSECLHAPTGQILQWHLRNCSHSRACKQRPNSSLKLPLHQQSPVLPLLHHLRIPHHQLPLRQYHVLRCVFWSRCSPWAFDVPFRSERNTPSRSNLQATPPTGPPLQSEKSGEWCQPVLSFQLGWPSWCHPHGHHRALQPTSPAPPAAAAWAARWSRSRRRPWARLGSDQRSKDRTHAGVRAAWWSRNRPGGGKKKLREKLRLAMIGILRKKTRSNQPHFITEPKFRPTPK